MRAGTDGSDLPEPDVIAAGAVVVHDGALLLVHRPRYDDWSFPKGKQDPGERDVTTAVRECLEETGVEIRLGRPLPSMAYAQSDGRSKIVHYWRGEVVGDPDVSTYAPNEEIDEVAWMAPDKASARLSYQRDRSLLGDLAVAPKRTRTLVVARHAKALGRKKWHGDDDRDRPLTAEGEAQARDLRPVLAAYGVTRVVSSSSARCRQTVQPYVDEHVLAVTNTPALSEEHAEKHGVDALLDDLMGTKEPTVLCTHRPVLPMVLEHLGIDLPGLEPADLLVVHHRKGRVVAVELHATP